MINKISFKKLLTYKKKTTTEYGLADFNCIQHRNKLVHLIYRYIIYVKTCWYKNIPLYILFKKIIWVDVYCKQQFNRILNKTWIKYNNGAINRDKFEGSSMGMNFNKWETNEDNHCNDSAINRKYGKYIKNILI